MPAWLRNWLKVRFLTGFFVTVPAIATAWLLYAFWDAIDDFFSPGFQHIFGRRIPGLGFLTAVLLILFIGTIATNVVGRRIIGRIERLLIRVPIFRSIYPSVKQLLESFSPEKRSSFKSVVLAEHPRKDEFVFGFVTAEVVVDGSQGTRQMVDGLRPHEQPLSRGRDRAAAGGRPGDRAHRGGRDSHHSFRGDRDAGPASPRAADQAVTHPSAQRRTASPRGKSLPKKKWSAPSMRAIAPSGSRAARRSSSASGQ